MTDEQLTSAVEKAQDVARFAEGGYGGGFGFADTEQLAYAVLHLSAELAALRPTVLQVAAEDDVLNCLLRGDSVEYIRAIRVTSVSTLISQATERAAARAMKGEGA
jgi:hypothetical protein